ncbi:MAG: choice-of-anchor D domain-containing protein [Leptospirales bacterium]|nr:choice-of-anchor D domain-containing protein [Leptospirales bacterium]
MSRLLAAFVFIAILLSFHCPATVPALNKTVFDNALGLENEPVDNLPTIAAIAATAGSSGVSGPRVQLSQASVDYGPQACGGGNIVAPITIQNTGTQSLILTTPFGFSGNSQIVVDLPASSTVAPGGSTTFNITFNTSGGAAGVKNGTVTIMSNATNSPVTISVTANQTGSC